MLLGGGGRGSAVIGLNALSRVGVVVVSVLVAAVSSGSPMYAVFLIRLCHALFVGVPLAARGGSGSSEGMRKQTMATIIIVGLISFVCAGDGRFGCMGMKLCLFSVDGLSQKINFI